MAFALLITAVADYLEPVKQVDFRKIEVTWLYFTALECNMNCLTFHDYVLILLSFGKSIKQIWEHFPGHTFVRKDSVDEMRVLCSGRSIEELEAQLDYERLKRERLEAQLDDARREIAHLNVQIDNLTLSDVSISCQLWGGG